MGHVATGGARKHLPDGTRLRGDVNVLLLGDPSTAKSQLLKFVHKTAPIAVYTSGKGSSAAGLTASIIKDGQTGEVSLNPLLHSLSLENSHARNLFAHTQLHIYIHTSTPSLSHTHSYACVIRRGLLPPSVRQPLR